VSLGVFLPLWDSLALGSVFPLRHWKRAGNILLKSNHDCVKPAVDRMNPESLSWMDGSQKGEDNYLQTSRSNSRVKPSFVAQRRNEQKNGEKSWKAARHHWPMTARALAVARGHVRGVTQVTAPALRICFAWRRYHSSTPHGDRTMKSIFAAAVATLILASGALAAPGTGYDFYPDGHESYTGGNGR
jgi:hypothetical protein